MSSPDTPTTSATPPGPVLEFADNRLLIDLCGPYDQYLAAVEKALEIQVVRRGNFLTLLGDPMATERGAQVLQGLYARLEGGREVTPDDVDMVLRMGVSDEGTGVQDGDQIEMPIAHGVEIQTRKKRVEPRTKAQKAYVESLFANELAFGIGPAGTGKTYLAVAVGVSMFLSGKVDKIILSRPAVEAGEKLGFLPGTQDEKVDPYMQPLYDALNDFLPGKQLAKLREEKTIEIAPLAFMRGRTLSNAFVVLDEAQNATAMQMKMFLTRLGQGSRMVITGDRTQIDLPRGQASGLADAERLLKTIPKISFNYFTSKDVVRHPLVAAIIEAYEAEAERALNRDV
ncbi:PhoH family protein [Sulfitobacter sp. HNIBRBA2951]